MIRKSPALAVWIAAAALSLSAAEPFTVPLRTDLPESEEKGTTKGGDPFVRKVTRPTLIVFPASKPNGTAMIVAPGGGWNVLMMGYEGTDAAHWLNTHGITAIVLKYRVTLETREAGQKASIEDGLAAVKYVREHAREWKIDPKRIGIMGFSAGGYVAAGVAMQYTAESRPDFAAPIYAVTPKPHTVKPDAPPLFLAFAFDDQEVFLDDNTKLLADWKKAGGSAEMHVFETGGHGFGMKTLHGASDNWTDRLLEWMKRHELVR
ncbi:MAG: alpha/beta hydrolase [Acidobacteriota bacterium]